MKVTTLPLLKNSVTRVTRVTTMFKQLKSLEFFNVTRYTPYPYTLCNAALACNVKTPPTPLMAGFRFEFELFAPVARWTRLLNQGRGNGQRCTG